MNFTVNGLAGLFSNFPPALAAGVVLALGVIQLIVVITLAIAVKDDAERKRGSPDGLFLVSPWTWFFVVALTGGYLGAFGYWIIHYSTLRHRSHTNG